MLSQDFHRLSGIRARVILFEAAPRLLMQFTPNLSARAADDLRGLGVEIRTDTKVTDIQLGTVYLGGEAIQAETVIWAAGVAATPVARWLGVVPAHGGRVRVDSDLRVPGHPSIHVIGDAALAFNDAGEPLPGLAPVAKQEGRYVARAIRQRLGGAWPEAPPFRYRDYGTLATIGRGKAVAGGSSCGRLPRHPQGWAERLRPRVVRPHVPSDN